ncbi:MmgE/PrpD family protein [Nocardia sp. NPDC058518]|uniref:MmgE/PrpD family protein n=1 Tax=Nocardia sp. NPDC058518 TaxID=3346534 RepID=UPI0036519DD1
MTEKPDPTTETYDLAADLASFAAELSLEDLGSDVVSAVKTNIFDTMACAIAGSTAPAISVVAELVDSWSGSPQADAWILGGRYPAHHAAWLNSAMAHARDYDDTHDAAILHAGVSTVPSAIAAAQLRGGIDGAELIAAIAVGLEVTCRLGTATEIDIVESGYIYSSLLGYFGATAAAGRALGLNREQMWDAFGIVYSSAAGNHQVTRDSSLMKRLQPGLAAQAGVVAAQLAQRGIRGARNVFDGADGFSRVYLGGRFDSAVARKDLGSRFELLNLSYKPYPCCRDTHSTIDAVLQARQRSGRPATDIRTIEVGVTAPGFQMVCVPEEVRKAPKTIVEAQFSIPYVVAAAWTDGEVVLDHFTQQSLERTDLMDLAARVEPGIDKDIDRDWHRYVTPSRIRVEFDDGEELDIRVDNAKGHPTNPMQQADFVAKADNCASRSARPLGSNVVQRLSDTVATLETLDRVDRLVGILSPRE